MTTSITTKTIFLSYSRLDKVIADQVEDGLSALGDFVKITRDIRDASFRSNLAEFMASIRYHDFAILIVSRSFLQSALCLFEVGQLLEEPDFKARAMPIIATDADVHDRSRRLEYYSYWDELVADTLRLQEEWQQKTGEIPADLVRDLILYRGARATLDSWLAYLTGHVTITPGELHQRKFRPLFEAMKIAPDWQQIWARMVEISQLADQEEQDLAIDQFVDEAPRSGRFLRAKIALQRKTFNRAIYHCEVFLKHFGPVVSVLKMKGISQCGSGRYDLGRASFLEALQIAPDDAQGHYLVATTLAKEGRGPALHTAEMGFKRAIELDPALDLAYYNLGCIYEMQGKWVQAQDAFELATSANPFFGDSWFNLGLVNERQLQFEDAESCYRRALAIQPDHAKAHFNMGNIYWYQGDRETARVWYQEALDLDPNNPDALANLGSMLLTEGHKEKAAQLFHRCLEIQPHNLVAQTGLLLVGHNRPDGHGSIVLPDPAKGHGNLLTLLRSDGKLSFVRIVGDGDSGPAADEESTEVEVSASKDLPASAFEEIFHRMKQQNWPAAELAALEALAEDPLNADVHLALAGIYEKMGRFPRALRHHSRTLELSEDPGFQQIARLGIGYSWMELGRLRRAEKAYRLAYRSEPNEAYTCTAMGVVLRRRGHLDLARKLLEKAISDRVEKNRDPRATQASARANLAMVLVEQGDWPAARRLAEEAIALNPANPTAHSVLADVLGFGFEVFDDALEHLELARLSSQRNLFPPRLLSSHRQSRPSGSAGMSTDAPVDSAWIGNRDWFRAASRLQKAVALDPSEPENYEELAACFIARGYPSLGIQYLMQALALSPNAPRILFNLGSAHSLRDDNATAATFFQRALEADPASSNAACYLGLMHFREGRRHQAQHFYLRALKLDSGNGHALLNLGALYESLGDREAGAGYAYLVLDTDEALYSDSHRNAHQFLSLHFDRLHKPARAQHHLQQAKRLEQESLSYDELLEEPNRQPGV